MRATEKYLPTPEKKWPAFRAGDTICVSVKIREGDKERIQDFQGTVIKLHRNGISSSFTVRKISYGVGVERVFPLHSPSLHNIQVVTEGKVRRARLYYLRALEGRKARIEARLAGLAVADDLAESAVAQAETVLPEPKTP